jgi:ABC-type branched-subunit amino acid transport system substrate-binding protein
MMAGTILMGTLFVGGIGASTELAAGASSSPIVVGGVCLTSYFPGIAQGVNARIARQNKAGGVFGRKLKFIGAFDDNFVATTDASLQRQLIEVDHVSALMPLCPAADGPSQAAIALDAHIPAFGWGSTEASFCTDRNMFSWDGSSYCGHGQGDPAWFLPVLKATHLPIKGTKVNVPFEVAPGGGVDLTSIVNEAKKLGMDVVGSTTPNLPTSIVDYTPYVNAILATHPQLIVLFTTSETVALVGGLRAAGYKGPIEDFLSYTPTILSNPSSRAAMQGEYVLNEYPVAQDNTPATKQEGKDLRAIGDNASITSGNSIGYWSADMYIAALKHAGAGASPTKVINASNHWSYKPALRGGIGPVSYPADRTAPAPCGSLVRIKGSAFVSVSPYSCS